MKILTIKKGYDLSWTTTILYFPCRSIPSNDNSSNGIFGIVTVIKEINTAEYIPNNIIEHSKCIAPIIFTALLSVIRSTPKKHITLK